MSADPAPLARLREELATVIVDMPYVLHTDGDRTSLTIAGSPVSTLFELIDDSHFSIYFYCRTYSADWVGERTDLHDVASAIFAAYLRAVAGVSCLLRDVGHPASGIESELYGRYVVPVQPSMSTLRLGHMEEDAERIMTGAIGAQNLLHASGLFMHIEIEQHFMWQSEDLTLWTTAVAEAIGGDEVGDLDEALAYQRVGPSWLYWRSSMFGLTFLRHPDLSRLVRQLARVQDARTVTVPSVNGDLRLQDGCRNFVSTSSALGTSEMLAVLDMATATPPLFAERKADLIAIENALIAVTGDHLLVMQDETGQLAFDEEREALHARHSREAELLFAPTVFSWPQPTDPERFEDLIRELLEREVDVLHVRKSGSTFDRDAGRDLLIDRVVPRKPSGALRKNESPWKKIEVVGQCKTTLEGRRIGSSKVQGIVDAIETHHAGGYFLAVSTELTGSVVQKLDSLRRRPKYFIDWWTRIEIEQRLRQHRDIADRYTDIAVAF